MSAQGHLAVIGGGRMGEAIVGGLLAADALSVDEIANAEPDASRREALTASLRVRCVSDGRDLLDEAGVVLLAVKPQVIDAVVVDLADGLRPGTLVVSIAAGVTCARLEALLPEGTAVVRVMPNTPALVGQGMAVISAGAHAAPAQVEQVRASFAALGSAVVIDERYQDAATAISGSGPAYFAIFVAELTRAGVAHGLTEGVARTLAIQTMRGTADLLEKTGQSPDELVQAVSSPGGTTVAAIGQLDAGGFRTAVADAVDAAVRRAEELGRS